MITQACATTCVSGAANQISCESWKLAFLFLDTMQTRLYALKSLLCACKDVHKVLREEPSWKFLGINPTCNYPDYPHVRKFLHGLVHPLIGLEPTYSPGRPNRPLLQHNNSNRLWSLYHAPLLYDRDNVIRCPGSPRIRADSAEPHYRSPDELDYFSGVSLSDAFWSGKPWVLTFRADDVHIQNALEDRSQDWVHVDDDRFENWTQQLAQNMRTLEQVRARTYIGAGMQPLS